MNILLVGLGGAIGAVLRYLISLIPIKTSYPILTLLTNLIWRVFIGFVAGIELWKTSKNQSLFLKTGVCGGFTTSPHFPLSPFNYPKRGKSLALAAI